MADIPRAQQGQPLANLRILDVKEIKSVPHVPLSHPFVERPIGTIRREYLDHVRFWNASDLERKLNNFQQYYNLSRAHIARRQYTFRNLRRNQHAPLSTNSGGNLTTMGYTSCL
jgi:hypothetical protein